MIDPSGAIRGPREGLGASGPSVPPGVVVDSNVQRPQVPRIGYGAISWERAAHWPVVLQERQRRQPRAGQAALERRHTPRSVTAYEASLAYVVAVAPSPLVGFSSRCRSPGVAGATGSGAVPTNFYVDSTAPCPGSGHKRLLGATSVSSTPRPSSRRPDPPQEWGHLHLWNEPRWLWNVDELRDRRLVWLGRTADHQRQ